MNTFPTNRRSGGALILILIITGFVTLSLSTYFMLTQNGYLAAERSYAWNTALILAEAGLEDGLALVNKNQAIAGGLATWTATAVSADNWDTADQAAYRALYNWPVTNGTIYHVRRSPDTNIGYYDVYVHSGLNASNTGPTILSIGTVNRNAGRVANSGSNDMVTVEYKTDAVRKLLIRTKADGGSGGSLSAITSVDFKGNNVTIDSFDSGDPYHSDWQTRMTYLGTNFYGTYPTNPAALSGDPNPSPLLRFKRKDNAYVTSIGNLIDSQNAKVYGFANTAPGGTVSIGAQGSIGDVTWVPNQGAQPGRVKNDMNVVYKDVVLPTNFNSAITVAKRTTAFNYNGFAFDYVITNGGYYKITAQVSDSIYVRGTNVFLHLPSGVKFTGNSDTLWLETNSNLTIYSGADVVCGGNVGINNISQYAPAFALYGLPGCTSLKLGGNGNIVAFVYAPQADLELGGNGGNTDAVGAFTVRSVKINGNMGFHYDEALKLTSPATSYVTSQWQEVQ